MTKRKPILKTHGPIFRSLASEKTILLFKRKNKKNYWFHFF